MEYNVETGVLQGDTLAPFLFVLVLDCVLNAALTPEKGLPLTNVAAAMRGKKLAERPRRHAPYTPADFLTDLDYADDLAIVATSVDDAQAQLAALEKHAAQVGLKINVGKNKTEFVAADHIHGTIRSSTGLVIERVKEYTYLGHQAFDPDKAFAQRKRKAWAAIHTLDSVWCNDRVCVSLKRRLVDDLIDAAQSHLVAPLPDQPAARAGVDVAEDRQ